MTDENQNPMTRETIVQQDDQAAVADRDDAITNRQPDDRPADGNDINQVRELLFGNFRNDNDRRFRTIDRQFETTNLTLQRLIERVEREREDTLAQLRTQQLQSQMRLEEMQRQMNERLRQQQLDFDAKLEQLQQTVANMVNQLDDGKVDQQHLAGLLVDLGMRMKRSTPPKPERSTTEPLVQRYDQG